MKQRKSNIPTPLSMSPVIFPFSVQFWMIPPTLRLGPWILSPHTVAPRPRGSGQHDVILGALHPIPDRPSLSPEAGNALFLPGLRLGPWFPDVTFRPSTAQACPIALWSLTSTLRPRPRAPGGRTMSGSPWVPGATWYRESLTRCSAGDWGGNGCLRKPQGAGDSSSCWRGPFPHLGDLSRPSQGQPALSPPRHSALSQPLHGGPTAGLTSVVSRVLAMLSPGVT